MRNLTTGEQRMLAQMLHSQNQLIRSDNISPTDVNILPMQIVVDEVVVNHCVEVLGHELPFDSTALRQIVLSVLRAATDSALGHQENGKS